jgi:hypothetical protein
MSFHLQEFGMCGCGEHGAEMMVGHAEDLEVEGFEMVADDVLDLWWES